MNTTKRLIEQLEKLSGKKVVLKENVNLYGNKTLYQIMVGDSRGEPFENEYSGKLSELQLIIQNMEEDFEDAVDVEYGKGFDGFWDSFQGIDMPQDWKVRMQKLIDVLASGKCLHETGEEFTTTICTNNSGLEDKAALADHKSQRGKVYNDITSFFRV